MGFPAAWQQMTSHYARIVMRKGGFDSEDQSLLQDALLDVGFTAKILDHSTDGRVLYVPEMELWLPLKERYWRIETRRFGPVDRAVDDAIHAIITRHQEDKGKPAKARCSDCYACCNPPETWIVRPQRSRSCRLSQRLHPSKHRVPAAPVADPIYLYDIPRGVDL